MNLTLSLDEKLLERARVAAQAQGKSVNQLVREYLEQMQILFRLNIVQITPDDVLAAIDLHRLHVLSFWDALILHAARKAGCSVLYSEDMGHGQIIEGIHIRNPFIRARAGVDPV